jgi:preprotein translocase subunit SecG
MSTRTFVIVVAVVALLLAGVVYMHRPRPGGASRGLAPHGQR